MPRLHLFEFEDLSWFPKGLRDYGTDFLRFVANRFDAYKPMAPLIIKGVRHSGTQNIIDLASGGGGGWKSLVPHLTQELPQLKVMLTDYYPNVKGLEDCKKTHPTVVDYSTEQVDATDVPEELRGLRTMFLSFHHFKPTMAQKILQNAVDGGHPIAVFELQSRTVKDFIKNLFSPLFIVLTTPFVPPFRLGRLIFTYLIPLVPLYAWWDGLVSVLRTYSVKEMKALTDGLHNADHYVWEIGKHEEGPNTTMYMLGYPKENK